MPKPFTPQELRSSIENITKHIFLKRTTQKLNTAGKQIRFQFLSILSHELKTPLNAIEGYLKIIKERQLGDDLINYEQAIDRSLERIKGMRGLILDMLDFTKVESGQATDKIEYIDILPILRISLDTIKPFAIQKDVNVYLNTKESVFLDFDKSQLEIIFNNLLSNAVKYNKENGRVDIWVKTINEKVEITVSDTGIGMAEEDVEKLFVDFFRIKNKQTKNITGSGLGLSIIKKIIDLYQGSIQVSSILEKGSIFVITFPIKQ
ncbi:MAG: HAMP domain-containing sensor histidine kinase [Bacteroidota bacterium]